jgi:hypothetical protein
MTDPSTTTTPTSKRTARISAPTPPAFTPMMNTLRGLLLGTGIGHHDGWLASAWCLLLTAGGYVPARRLYNRDPR